MVPIPSSLNTKTKPRKRFETRYGCCPQRWLNRVSCVAINSCRLSSGVLCFSFMSYLLFPSFFPNIVFVACLLSYSSIFVSFLLQIVRCARLHFWCFGPRARCGWHWMAKSPCCNCNVYLCFVVCERRACLPSRRHLHGHRLRWV